MLRCVLLVWALIAIGGPAEAHLASDSYLRIEIGADGKVGGLIVGAGAAEATPGLSVALFSVGGSIASASVLSYGLLAARRLDLEWGRIARRAGASWIAAIGLMVLALSFVPPTRHG